jgi:hypothetical protein
MLTLRSLVRSSDYLLQYELDVGEGRPGERAAHHTDHKRTRGVAGAHLIRSEVVRSGKIGFSALCGKGVPKAVNDDLEMSCPADGGIGTSKHPVGSVFPTELVDLGLAEAPQQ